MKIYYYLFIFIPSIILVQFGFASTTPQQDLNAIHYSYNALRLGWGSDFEIFYDISNIFEIYHKCKYSDLPRIYVRKIDSVYTCAIPVIEQNLDRMAMRYSNKKDSIRYGEIGAYYCFIGAKAKGKKILNEYKNAEKECTEKDLHRLLNGVFSHQEIGMTTIYRAFSSIVGQDELYYFAIKYGCIGPQTLVDSLVKFWTENDRLKIAYNQMDSLEKELFLYSIGEYCNNRAIPIVDKLLHLENKPQIITYISEIKNKISKKTIPVLEYSFNKKIRFTEPYIEIVEPEDIVDSILRIGTVNNIPDMNMLIFYFIKENFVKQNKRMSNCGRIIDSLINNYQWAIGGKIKSLISNRIESILKIKIGVTLICYNDFYKGEQFIMEGIQNDINYSIPIPGILLERIWLFDLETFENVIPFFEPYLFKLNNFETFLKIGNTTSIDSVGRFISEYVYNNSILDSVYSVDYVSRYFYTSQVIDYKSGIIFNDKNGSIRLEILQAMRGKDPVPNPNYLKHWAYLANVETDPALRDIIYGYINEIPQIHPGLWGPYSQTLKEDIPIAIEMLKDDLFIDEGQKIKRNMLIDQLYSMFNQL